MPGKRASVGTGLVAADFLRRYFLLPNGKARHEAIDGTFSAITGYSPKILKDRAWESLVYPKDKPRLAGRNGRLLKGIADVSEYRIMASDGRLKWLRDYAQPVMGRPIRVICAVHDISADRRAGEERARLESIIEASEDAIMDLSLDGVVLSWNRAAGQMYGYSSKEIKGRSASIMVPGEKLDEMARILEDLRNNENLLRIETIRLRLDGSAFPAALTIAPMRDAAGNLNGASIISRDISQLRRAESALENSARKTSSILSTMVDAVITIDERGIIDSLNPAAERLFGYSARDVLGKNVKMLMPQPYRNEHDRYLANYLRTSRAKIIGIGREVVGMRRNGSTFPMDLAVSEVNLGERRLFTGIVRDLTDRTRLERQILEISDREQRRIGQDLHDGLGQQLAGIGFLSKSLENRLIAAKTQYADDARNIAQLVSEAIAQARGMAHGLHPVDLSATGLMAALKELASTVEHTFRIKCRFECRHPVLLADPVIGTHLYRIAQEAVNNAIKHGRAGRVTIALSRNADAIGMSVRDNGVGFPEVLPQKHGIGLQTMRYRAALIGAALKIGPNARGGTRVDCALGVPANG